MKRKSPSLLVFSLTLLFSLGIPGCDGPDYAAIRGIEKLSILDRETGNILGSLESTSSDSLALWIETEVVYFTYDSPGSMSSALATSPPDPEMANELVDIRVFCDQPIFGFEPGQNIAPTLRFGYDNYQFTLTDYLSDIPGKGDVAYGWNFPISVFLNSKPEPGIYSFSVEMEDNNGHVFSSSSHLFNWL